MGVGGFSGHEGKENNSMVLELQTHLPAPNAVSL
jgi:hypothetical protein